MPFYDVYSIAYADAVKSWSSPLDSPYSSGGYLLTVEDLLQDSSSLFSQEALLVEKFILPIRFRSLLLDPNHKEYPLGSPCSLSPPSIHL